MPLTRCSDCGHQVSTRAASCPNCVAPVDPTRSDCGNPLPQGATTCPNCGAPLPSPSGGRAPVQRPTMPSTVDLRTLHKALHRMAPMSHTRAHTLLLAPYLCDPGDFIHVERGTGVMTTILIVVAYSGVYEFDEENFAVRHLPARDIEGVNVQGRMLGADKLRLTLTNGQTRELPLSAEPHKTANALDTMLTHSRFRHARAHE